MSYYMKELKLPNELFEEYELVDDDPINRTNQGKVIRNLSRVNIFVGENNSGKSRFLRKLIFTDHKQYEFLPNLADRQEVENIIQQFKAKITDLLIKYQISSIYSIESPIKSIIYDINESFNNNVKFISLGSNNPNNYILNIISELSNCVSSIIDSKHDNIVHYQDKNGTNQNVSSQNFIKIYPQFSEEIKNLAIRFPDILKEKRKNYSTSFYRIYIPMLRGLRKTSSGADDYHYRIFQDYFKPQNDRDKINHFEIYTGLGMYQSITSMLLGDLNQRKKISDFQIFLRDNFFPSAKDLTIIPIQNQDIEPEHKVVYVKIGDEDEFPIYHLGDGIQSIIIYTFPLFKNSDKNLLVFIEEPELNLHPGLQRKLIEVFLDDSKFGNCQFFIATHSNHILDMTLDMDQISVYTFRKKPAPATKEGATKPTFLVKNVNNDDNQVLSLLGVKNSSVFLSNCTIWVEGITDRLYIRKFFEIYQREKQKNGEPIFREDIHYSFVEYGGANITHWSFLDEYNESKEKDPPKSISVEKLCGRLFLITDKDSQKKEPRHKSLEKCLGKERYHCLECREIENVLNEEVILCVISQYEKKTIDETIEIVGNIKRKDYFNKYLGVYIEKKLGDKKIHNYVSTKSKALTDKVNFCKRALHCIDTTENFQLSVEAKTICEKIYAFIKKENS